MTRARRAGLRAAERSASPAPPAKGLRRDAQRNRDAIVAAAQETFSEQGLEAPLEEIARRAGVGIGTLYRRFPTRVDLVDAVLAGRLRAHVDAAERALAISDPWEGFAFYLEQTCQLEASDRGLGDVMSMRFPRATAVETAKTRLYELVTRVVRRAQASGQLRADLTLEDLAFLNWANARIVEATKRGGARRLAPAPELPARRLPRRPRPRAALAAAHAPAGLPGDAVAGRALQPVG